MTLEERLLAYMDEHDWARLDGVQRDQVRVWPDGTYLCAQALLDYWVLIEGTLDEGDYYDQWEYHTEEEARAALAAAPEGETLGDWAPTGWYNRRPASYHPRVPLPPRAPRPPRPLRRVGNRPAWRH